MAEWSKATVLKTVEPQGSVGSNPTPSATGHGGSWRPTAPESPGNAMASVRERSRPVVVRAGRKASLSVGRVGRRVRERPWRGARVAESGRLLSG